MLSNIIQPIIKPIIQPIIRGGEGTIYDILGTTALFSTRKASNTYSGSCVRVRRASDNAEQDIGFKNGWLDEDALEEFGGYNLLGYTDDFSNLAWQGGKVDRTLSSNPNPLEGGGGVYFLENSSSVLQPASIFQSQVLAGEGVLSGYFKYDSCHIQLRPFGIGTNRAFANFDLQNGVVSRTGGADFTSASIENVGDGWYRCEIKFNPVSTYGGALALIEKPNDPELPNVITNIGLFAFGVQLVSGITTLSYQTRSAGRASDCFVATWYDQSGNANDATQTTDANQPKIYDLATASVIKENSKSTIEFNGVNDFVRVPNIAGISTMDIFFVNRHYPTIGTASEYLYPYSNSEADKFGFVAQDGSSLASIVNYGSPSLYKNGTLVSPSNTRNLVYNSLGQSQNLVMHQGANVSSWTDFSIGNFSNTNFSFGGTFQEIAVFSNLLTTEERQQVQDDINSKFNIY